MRHFRRIPTALAMALLALVSGVPSGLVVLCVGTDGHVAVEFGGAAVLPAPAEAPGACAFAAGDACACDDGCGPCRDSNLECGPTLRARGIEEGARPEASPGALPARGTETWRPADPSPAGTSASGRPDVHPRHLRTTVLRI